MDTMANTRIGLQGALHNRSAAAGSPTHFRMVNVHNIHFIRVMMDGARVIGPPDGNGATTDARTLHGR